MPKSDRESFHVDGTPPGKAKKAAPRETRRGDRENPIVVEVHQTIIPKPLKVEVEIGTPDTPERFVEGLMSALKQSGQVLEIIDADEENDDDNAE